MQPIYTREPFERVTMGIIGRLPKTDRVNRYIHTVVDHFTKHVEAYALSDQEEASLSRVSKWVRVSIWSSVHAAHQSKRYLDIKFI